jgi:flagellar basal-body rod protein FlgC
MSFFSSFDVSATGLTAERFRMDVIANNIANAETTRTKEGGPYRRQAPVFAPIPARFEIPLSKDQSAARETGGGVRVLGINEDKLAPKMVYDPSHPDANKEGYVAYPNVDVVREMVDMISASRAYEANVTAINMTKQMINKALMIGK